MARRPPRKLPTRLPKLQRSRLVLRFRALLPSTREAISLAVDKVLTVAQHAGCLGDDVADVEIALREALANAVIHGNQGIPRKKILLRCYGIPGDGLLLVVRDEGPGFDATAVPDPRDASRLQLTHGRGIFLMRELMDHAEHRKGGREVVLFKACGKKRPRPASRPRPKHPARRGPRGRGVS